MSDNPILVNGNVNYNSITFIDYASNIVGINTSSPTFNLEVNGSTFSNRYLIGTNSINYQYLYYDNDGYGYWTTSTGAPVMYVNNTSNLGIGTNSPNTKLQVNGSLSANISLVNGAPITNIYQNVGLSYTPTLASQVNNAIIYNTSGPNFSSALDLSNLDLTNNNSVYLSFSSLNLNNDRVAGAQIGAIFHDHSGASNFPNTSLYFSTGYAGSNPIERMRITPGGNVGIGLTNPSAKLDVNGMIRSAGAGPHSGGYAFSGIGDNDSGLFSTADGTLQFYTNIVERMRIINSGNVGIGTTNPLAKLYINTIGNAQSDFSVKYQNLTGTTISTNHYFESGTTDVLYYSNSGALIGSTRAIKTNAGTKIFDLYGYDYVQIGSGGSDSTLKVLGDRVAPFISTAPGFYHRAFTGLGIFSDNSISFEVNGSSLLTTAMFIKNNKYIGIGTDNPSGQLTIVHASSINDAEYSYNGFKIDSGSDIRSFFMGYDNTYNASYMNVAMIGFIQSLCIQTRGANVGIGTTNPQALLHVYGGIGTTNLINEIHPVTSSTGLFTNGTVFNQSSTNWGSNIINVTSLDGHETYQFILDFTMGIISSSSLYFEFNSNNTNYAREYWKNTTLFGSVADNFLMYTNDGSSGKYHTIKGIITYEYDSNTNVTYFSLQWQAKQTYPSGLVDYYHGSMIKYDSGNTGLSSFRFFDTDNFRSVNIKVWKI